MYIRASAGWVIARAPGWGTVAARIVHGIFYLLLIAVPVSGLLAIYVSEEFGEIHEVGKPLFIAMAYKESSFDTSARGRLGEFGLVQVHGKAKRGCDLGTPEGQAQCGAKWLSRVVQECGGSVVLDAEKCRATGARGACSGGLAGYASGSCSARTTRTAQIIRARLKLAEKIRPFLLDETAVLVRRIF